MEIRKIKDSYIFDKNKESKGSHWYLVFGNKKNDNLFLREFTHLYQPDSKRMQQVKHGLLFKGYVKGFECPQGINNKIIYKSIDGNIIKIRDLNNNTVFTNDKNGWYRKN